MSATPRSLPRRAGLVAACLLPLVLSACGAGHKAETYRERTVADSTNDAVGTLALRGVMVLPPPDGVTYAAGSTAKVALTVVNESDRPDRLLSVTSEAAESVQIVGANGQPASVTVPGLGVAPPFGLTLTGLKRPLRAAQYVTLTFAFETNGTRDLMVPVGLTGTPAPQRSGYEVAETDSEGKPIVKGDNVPEGGSDTKGNGAEGEAPASE